MRNTQKGGSNSSIKHAGREEIKEKLQILLEGESSFKSQNDILEALREMEIETNQTTLSRALNDIGAMRNEDGEWVLNQDGFGERLKLLKELFDCSGGFSRLYSDIETVILRTPPNYNVLIAQQIATTFTHEVLSTLCPNSTDIIIYYRRRKKKTENTERQLAEEREGTLASNAQQVIEESPYRKSRMRIELVKLCKATRQKAETDSKKGKESKTGRQ